MSGERWTPGPWFVRGNHVGPKNAAGLAYLEYGPLFVGEEHAANARLIAAAPELYEAASAALQYIVVAYRDGKENGLSESTLKIAERDHANLVAALQKARGQEPTS